MEKLSEGFIDDINQLNDFFQASIRQTGFEHSKALAVGAMSGLLVSSLPIAIGAFFTALLFNSGFRIWFLHKVGKCLGEKIGQQAIEALRVQKTFDSGTSSEMIEARKARKVLEEIRAKLNKMGC